MKLLAFLSGALSLSLIPLGILFKLMHWPAAGVLLTVGIILFSVVFVPTITAYLYKKGE